MKAVACKMQFRKVPDYKLWLMITNVKNQVTRFLQYNLV